MSAGSGGTPTTMGARIFLGREDELTALEAALDEAIAGRGSLQLLVGEPGIGKTRLAEEVAARATERGAWVVWSRGWEAGGAPAYWHWAQILSGLARREELAPAFCDADGAWQDGLRWLAGPSESVAEAYATDSDVVRFQRFRAVASALGSAAGILPLVLILDDLHTSDHAALLLLQFIAGDLRSVPMLIIGTYRDVEARPEPAVQDALNRLGQQARQSWLQRLERHEAADLIRSRLGDIGDEVVTAVFTATQGNPLFLDQVIGIVAARGGPKPDAHGAVPLPFGMREAIRVRLSQVRERARDALEVAAVVGVEFAVAALARVASLSADEVPALLAEAVSAGLVHEVDTTRYAFSHSLFREVLYRDLPRSRRLELHGRVAESLEAIHCAESEPPLAELAHHSLEALPGPGLERAIEYALRAADRARRLMAYQAALSLLERARAALELAPRERRLLAEVRLVTGEVQIASGDGSKGQASCQDAAALARSLGDAELFCRAALGYGAVFTWARTDPQLVSLLEDALERLGEQDSPLRACAMARLAAARQPARDPSEPIALAREAIAMARRLRSKATLLAVLRSANATLIDYADPRERAALGVETVWLARELGDRQTELTSLARLVIDYLEAGERDLAVERARAHSLLANELGYPRDQWIAALLRGDLAMQIGAFEEAEQCEKEAVVFAERTEDRNAHISLTFFRMGLLRAREQHADLVAHSAAVRAVFTPMVEGEALACVFEAMVQARRGDAARARKALAAVDAANPILSGEIIAMAWAAEAGALVRDTALCEQLYRRLMPLAERNLSLGLTGMSGEGPISRQLGLLAAATGRWEESLAHLEHARMRCEALGLTPHLARVLYEIASTLLARGATGDLEKARGLLERAKESAESLGMSGLVTLIEGCQGETPSPGKSAEGAPAPSAAPSAARAAAPTAPASIAFSLRLEGEYWTVTHPGGTFRLKDLKGLRLLAQLVDSPNRSFYCADLMAPPGERGLSSDAGEVLDAEARAAYRRRYLDLQESLREAESFGDIGRAEKARDEMERLSEELARGVGLGGRSRRAGSTAERARSAVQRRLKDAIGRIAEHAPELGRHLAWAVRTGTFCTYYPAGPPA